MAKLGRFQVIPLPDHQVAFQLDGVERARWHFGPNYPRPFFYPFIGPSGRTLTRMGHPGAPDHDHHRSIWFAHHKVLGIDFWGDRTTARIRQKQWLAYQDGDDEAVMAVLLGWYDGHDPKELLEHELIAGMWSGEKGEIFLELQSTFRPRAESLEFGKTNFGFLAVRVAKEISAHFGGGQIISSEGAVGEPAIFGKPARWMNYSGPAPLAGITYFDHPKNPGYPTCWHVREDGWMGAAVCFNGSVLLTRKQPLVLRYLLHAHARALDPKWADDVAKSFTARPAWVVSRAKVKHRQYVVERAG
jgi:hypothetical protein